MPIPTHKLKPVAIILLVIAAAVFVGLAILVHYHNVFGADIFLSKDLQAEGDTPERRTIIYRTLYAISLFGKPLIASIGVAMAGLLFFLYRHYREAIYILLTPVSAIINSGVKLVVGRPRPSSNLVQILATEHDASFPSGHVSFYTVFFGLLFILLFYTPNIPKIIRWIVQAISLFLIITISLSRVYLGVHWVTDTIGGYLLGLIILSGFLYFYFRLRPRSQTN